MLYNILSLALGCLAWLCGASAIAARTVRTCHRLTATSLTLSALSLLSQLCELRRLSILRDFAAVEDTVGAVVLAAAVLVGVTLLLCGIAVFKAERRA